MKEDDEAYVDEEEFGDEMRRFPMFHSENFNTK